MGDYVTGRDSVMIEALEVIFHHVQSGTR